MKTTPISPLSERQKRLVRESFETVRGYDTAVVKLFYGRLFELAPETRALFKIDIRKQSQKLLDTLGTAVDALDHFDELLPALGTLGEKHVAYGVKPAYYATLRTAFLWALGQSLGMALDKETRDAWEQLLTNISTVMIDAAEKMKEA
jgi:nitric oxide dioxygenase